MSDPHAPTVPETPVPGTAVSLRAWWRTAWPPVLVGVATLLVLLWPDRGVVPLFDGWSFARCAVDAPWVAVRCEGHPSLGWGFVMALGKLGALPGATTLFLPSLVFGALALAGLDWLAVALLGAETRVERWLLVVGFALHPVFLSTVLQPNLDVALTAWMLWMLAGVARGRVVEVAGFGALLIFAKETGLLLYGAAGLVMWWRAVRTGDAVRTACVLALPVLLYGGFLLMPQPEPMYIAGGRIATVSNFHPFDLWNHQLLNYIVLMGVLDYQWVVTLGWLVATAVALRAHARARAGAGGTWGAILDAAAPAVRVGWTLAIGLALVTSYRSFGNARYFTFALPLVALALLVASRRAAWPRHIARGVLVLWGILMLTALRSSTDPVMSRVAGTFSTGLGRMYDMTRISRECCGRGRDQLVYNLQYTEFARAMDSAMVHIGAARGVTVAMSRYAHWHAVTPVDAATGVRTLGAGVDVPLRYTEDLASGAESAEHAWLIEWPTTPLVRDALVDRYTVRDAGSVSSGGVTLRLAELTRRAEVAK